MKPIVITEADITQAMLALAGEMDDDGTEHTEQEMLDATETWLRGVVRRVLESPGCFAFRTDNHLPEFNVPAQCQIFRCAATPAAGDIFCARHRELEESYARDRREARADACATAGERGICIYEDCSREPEAGSNLCETHAAHAEYLDDPRNWRAAEEERQSRARLTPCTPTS